MTTKIFHNPRCSTSRNVLAIMKASGETPEIIEYLKTPPTRAELEQLIAKTGGSARDILRSKETISKELRLNEEGVTDEQILDAMMQHPVLINRPIVVTDKGVALCRPVEKVFELLANPVASFTKENGDVISPN